MNLSYNIGTFSSETLQKYSTINETDLDFGFVQEQNSHLNYNRMNTICILIIIAYSHSSYNHINRVSFCGTYVNRSDYGV